MDQLPIKKKNGVRVRFAPSPTGPFHIGGARTALFNYLFARKNQGSFILRIEDTDKERSSIEWENDIIDNLRWLGIWWDEGIAYAQNQKSNLKSQKYEKYIGDFGPYRQSERKEIYEKYIKELYEKGYLYWCFCAEEELKVQKEDQISRGEPPKYSGHCRNLTEEKQKEMKGTGRKGFLRFKVPERKIKVQDLIRGEVEFDTDLMGDFIVARDFFTPLYNLAVVIDDFEMKITHIIRGEDHISNTPKQILIQEVLDFPMPEYAHLPLILGSDRSKLSKRHGTVKVSDYSKQGYLPEAIVNFMVLLGWNPGTEQEKLTISELTEKFSLERVQKGGAIFNIKKLDWVNSYYIRQKPLNELTQLCLPYLIQSGLISIISNEDNIPKYKISETDEDIGLDFIQKIVSLFQERLKKISEIADLSDFFFKKNLTYDSQMLIWKDITETEVKTELEKCCKVLDIISKVEWRKESIKERLMKELEREKDKGKLLWPLRVALSGKKASPPPFEIAEILGKEKTLARIKDALKLIETNRN